MKKLGSTYVGVAVVVVFPAGQGEITSYYTGCGLQLWYVYTDHLQVPGSWPLKKSHSQKRETVD